MNLLHSAWTLLRGVDSPVGVAIALISGRVPVEVRLPAHGLTVSVRSALELLVLKEVVLDAEYDSWIPEEGSGFAIIDVGAGFGSFVLRAARRFPGCSVTACEPSPDSAALLARNLAANGIRNVTVLPVAVTGARVATAVLDGPEVPPVLRRASPAAGEPNAGARLVAAVPLGDLLGEGGMPRCDLLKLDCEGAEVEIILGTSAEALERVSRIALEYHSEEDGRSSGALISRLLSLGFLVSVVASPFRRDQGHIYAWRAESASTHGPMREAWREEIPGSAHLEAVLSGAGREHEVVGKA